MAEYRRWIARIYSYEKGIKKTLSGLAWLETYDGELRLKVEIKVPQVSGKSVPVYFFKRHKNGLQGVLLGELNIQNGNGKFYFITPCQNISRSGLHFLEMNGIVLYMDALHYFGSQWDEKPITQKGVLTLEDKMPKEEGQIWFEEEIMNQLQDGDGIVRAASVETSMKRGMNMESNLVNSRRIGISQQSMTVEEARKRHEEKMAARAKRSGTGIELTSSREKKEITQKQDARQQEERERAERERAERQKKEMEMAAEEKRKKEEEARQIEIAKQNEIARQKEIERQREEAKKKEEEHLLKEAKKRQEEKKAWEEAKRKEEERQLEEARILAKEEKRQEEERNEARRKEEEKRLLEEKLLAEIKRQEEARLAESIRQQEEEARFKEARERENQASKSQEARLWNEQVRQQTEEARGVAAVGPKEVEAEQTSQREKIEEAVEEVERFRALKHLQEMASREESAKEGMITEDEEKQSEEDTNVQAAQVDYMANKSNARTRMFPWMDVPQARNILDSHPHMYPFEDGEIAECVRIEPNDIGMFPMETWGLGNNSFIRHAYFNYRHLLFAKKQVRDGCLYLLMVPGVYNPREKHMARMFGFDYFKCVNRKKLRVGEFGYWYLPINFQ